MLKVAVAAPVSHDDALVIDQRAASTDHPDGARMFVETSDPTDQYLYRLARVLHEGQTAFQRVLIAETVNYGLALMLDGAIQSSEDDEQLYHEMLVQPAMLRHPAPRDVLIIGGGEGASLREVLAHRSVQSATMVDIDQEVVELCREHLPTWHQGAFDDPRARLRYADGRAFVEHAEAQYDVVIIDVVDMFDNGPAQALYTRQFYQHLKRRLRPGALVVVQGMEFSFLDDRQHAALARTLRTLFSEVYSYQAMIPSFLGMWGFIVASDWFRPEEWSATTIDRAIQHRLPHHDLHHLTGHFLSGAFQLSKTTQELLAQPGPTLEDRVALTLPPPDEEITARALF